MNFPPSNQQINRFMIAFLAILAIGILVLLSTSLNSLEFKPAQQFFLLGGSWDFFPELTESTEGSLDISIGDAILLGGGLVAIILLLFLILSPTARKRFLKNLLRMGLAVWLIYYLIRQIRPGENIKLDAQASEMDQAAEALASPPPYNPPDIPALALYLISMAILLGLGVAGYLLYRRLQSPSRPLHEFSRAARSALEELASGADWGDSVISCYKHMNAAVSEHRGLFRKKAMTPTEFARRLEQAGLPSGPVRRLTILFEKARYSGRSSSTEDVNEAVACLSSILLAVEEKA
jgi:hypothetical protein